MDSPGESLPPLLPQQKESLIMLIAINYAEQHDLLNAEQLADARASLRALFLQATGEETMLRKLIGILNVNRALNRTFSEMAHVLDGIRKSNESLVSKHDSLKLRLAALAIAPEAHAHFVGPLLEYAGVFLRAVAEFDRQMLEYKVAREAEARNAHIFRLAREARERLKQRFEQGAAVDTREEEKVKKKVIRSFNYAEAESEYRYAKRSADRIRGEIDGLLGQFQQLCQLAMKPDMRGADQFAVIPEKPDYIDIYSVCAGGLGRFAELRPLQETIQDLLRLYQRSYGMFILDFDKFSNALGPMSENTEDYFQAKEQDEDVRTKQKKLVQIEALIAFIEDVSALLRDRLEYSYPKFSQAVSTRIALAGSKWAAITEPLLQMKVAAEAELTTRLG